MTENNQIRSQKFSSIQALRGLGAISVTIFHALSLFPLVKFQAGAAGVDLFFIISGIVMCISIKEGDNPLCFLKKRCIRVVPMYWIASATAVLYFYSRYPEMPPSFEHILRSFLFLPPPPSFNMPILYPGWSLNFEMFFYVILSILLYAGRLAVPASMCLIATLGTAMQGMEVIGKYYYSQLLLEFVAGLALGQAIKNGYTPKKREASIFLVTAISLMVLHSMNNSTGVLAWGIPCLFLTIGALGFEGSAFIKLRIIQFFGKSSYSIYLFHALAIWMVDWIWPFQPGGAKVISAVILSLVTGSFVFKFIEEPLLEIMRRHVKFQPTHRL